MQSVGGYGVLAVACASSWLSIGGGRVKTPNINN